MLDTGWRARLDTADASQLRAGPGDLVITVCDRAMRNWLGLTDCTGPCLISPRSADVAFDAASKRLATAQVGDLAVRLPTR